MAGVSVDTGGKAERRAVDSQINMIPMIDLLICCISFLLITAVWSQMSRLDAGAQVPGESPTEITSLPPEPTLHIEMRGDDKFRLIWKQGRTVTEALEVPRRGVPVSDGKSTQVRFPDLATQVDQEWRVRGTHRDSSDGRLDQAVLHTDDATRFSEIAAVIDALYTPKREIGRASHKVPAFNVTFAVN